MTSPSGSLHLAWQFHQSGQLDLAARLYRQLLEREPRNPDAHHLLGLVALQQGKPAAAIEHLQKAIECFPAHAQFHDHLADAYKEAGNRPAAIACYRNALQLEPDSAVTWNELGSVLRDEGQVAEAETAYRRAIETDPQLAEAHNNLGNTLQDQQRYDEAIKAFKRAAELRPDSAEIRFNLGNCYRFQKDFVGAVETFREAIALNTNLTQAHVLLGVSLQEQQLYTEASDCFREALRQRPDLYEALMGLGVTMQGRKRFDEAMDCYRQVLRRWPDSYMAEFNLAACLHSVGRYEEGFHHYGAVADRQPQYAEAIAGQGAICQILSQWDQATEFVKRALAIEPDHPDLRFQLGTIQLTHGNLKDGLAEFDYRTKGRYSLRKLAEPRWEGESLEGKTLLVYWEYGYGDAFHFIRYLPLIPPGGRVLCEILPQLIPILEGSGYQNLIALHDPLPHIDCQVPLLSLPYVMGTTIDTIPANVPYIFADPQLVEIWRERMRPIEGFRVGIHWQGNQDYFNDRHRSMKLALFEPIARVEGVKLISLQRGFGSEQIGAVADRFEVLTLPDMDDYNRGAFTDTAALLKNLDLVITSDSAVAHLAGAMGVPVWLLLCTSSEWRWFLDREDSPWYPTMRIFRQKQLDVWPEVFDRVAAELSALVSGK